MSKFSNLLKDIVSKSGIKNLELAQAVKYDESYISKWLSGRVIPSERYIDRIVAQIAECVVEESSESNLSALCSEFGASKDCLKDVIIECLMNAYKGETDFHEDSFRISMPLISVIKKLSWNGASIISADVFSMEHESRLLLAGIHDGSFIGNFAVTEKGMENSVKILLNVNGIQDKIYDPIFLIHMMTSLSNSRFELYDCPFSAGRLIFADDSMVVSAHLLDENRVISMARQKNAAVAVEMKSVLDTFCTQETLLVKAIDDLLGGYTYMQSILSTSYDWITGHFTEQMVPEELFKTLSDNVDIDNISQIGCMLRDVASKARILIYRSAFTKFLINGELDFFNHKVFLTPEQQAECISNVHRLAECGTVRIIDGGFSSDFLHISDPCVFLADSVDYIRLENGEYENNLWNIVNRNLRTIYHDFFNEVWDNGGPVVIKEKDVVLNIIDLYRIKFN